MQSSNSGKPSLGGPGAFKRKSRSVSSEQLVSTGFMKEGRTLPLLIQPAVDGLDLCAWAARNRDFIETNLLTYGAILFRNFDVDSVTQFEQFITTLSGEMLEYTYRSTPRTLVSGNVYTSTEYPADQTIPAHNELAYASSWPLKVWFFCRQPSPQGGETPIVDSRKVYTRLSPHIREKFMQKKVMYVRNFGEHLDLPWQNVFQTEDRAEVEEYCRRAHIEFEWRGERNLRTRQICHAALPHPRTGEMVWFNQAHLFHVSGLKEEVRRMLLSSLAVEDLSRHACYGDGSPLEEEALAEVREVYRLEEVTFSWQERDVLMLDNMLTAHGRKPFVGARKILVGMAEAFGVDSL